MPCKYVRGGCYADGGPGLQLGSRHPVGLHSAVRCPAGVGGEALEEVERKVK